MRKIKENGGDLIAKLKRAFSELDYCENNMYDVRRDAKANGDWGFVNDFEDRLEKASSDYNGLVRQVAQDPSIDISDVPSFAQDAVKKWKAIYDSRRKEDGSIMSDLEAAKQKVQDICSEETKAAFLNDKGDLKFKGQYGAIKTWKNKEEKKALKNLWVATFAESVKKVAARLSEAIK